jgi:hypothetical protein
VSFFNEPWDPDAPLVERLIARGPALGVLVGMIAVWARLLWLWNSGVIKTEPFWGSTRWNLAIVVPVAAILATWWLITSSRARKRERRLSAIMTAEPLSGWHRRIRALDSRLVYGTSRAVEQKIRALTLEVVDAYPELDATQREHVRLLWRSYEN